ncbi:MAG: hypothetical protein ACOCQP_02980, partial [Lentisphaeria bacterium]
MTTYYNHHQLQKLLALNPPALMLDKVCVENGENGRKAQGIKNVSIAEEFFIGHFPGSPIMPGVLQITGMFQTAKTAILETAKDAFSGNWQLTNINRIKFRNPVYPGDQLKITVETEAQTENKFTVKAWAETNGVIASQGNLEITRNGYTDRTMETEPFNPPLPTGSENGGEPKSCDVTELMCLIPHRYPFLLVDRVLNMNSEKGEVIGLKNITGNEPFFQAGQSDFLPPELQAEIAAQIGCSMAMDRADRDSKIAYFMSIDDATFYSPALPGDQLVAYITIDARSKFGKGSGVLKVGDQVISEIKLKFAIVP